MGRTVDSHSGIQGRMEANRLGDITYGHVLEARQREVARVMDAVLRTKHRLGLRRPTWQQLASLG